VTALAGGIGQPGWQFSLYNGKWDALGTEVSPWFPSMRVFRQPRPGDWQSVMQCVATKLARLTAQHNGITKGEVYDRQ
jgi:hypothetical protein